MFIDAEKAVIQDALRRYHEELVEDQQDDPGPYPDDTRGDRIDTIEGLNYNDVVGGFFITSTPG